MTSPVRAFWTFCLVTLLSAAAMAAPVRMIVDTDMMTDCDDVGSLAVLHALADRGEVEILAVMVGVLNPWSAPCTDAINTYYGRPNVPIGQLKGAGVNLSSKFAQGIAEGFAHDVTAVSAPDAVALYRQILAGEADNSVVIATLGYMTNLQGLLNSPADAISPLTGRQLIAQKVKKWVCMGGNFPDDYLQTQVSANVNFRRDAPAAIDCVNNWPGAIEFVGREIGHAMKAGGRLTSTPSTNPVRRAYELFFSGTAKDQHCADPSTVLYAVRGLAFEGTTYWGIENTGSVYFTQSDARFQWVDPPDAANQAYITEILDPNVIEEVIEDLMIQPPGAVVSQWGRFEAEVPNATSYADPYRDVTLNVSYTSPSGASLTFWGYYDGGQSWKIRFMPNEPGTWQYSATFSDGSPGKSGTFTCAASGGPSTIGAYAANPRWFGHRNGAPFLMRSFHAAGLFKLALDDPENPNDGEKRKAFLDWAKTQGYNTFSAHFFSTRDATDNAGPKLWPLNHDTYRKVEKIIEDLSDREMVAYAFTGFFPNSGPYPSTAADRTLYIRYCLARFAPYWNIIMNVGGFEVRDYLSDTEIKSLGAEITAANPFGHLLGAHQRDGDDRFRNEPWCTFATLQAELTSLSSLNTYLLNNYVTGKPVYAQETLWMGNNLQPNWTLTDLRKQMWVHMMSAAAYNAGDMNGNNESGFGGCLDLAQKIQARHDVPKAIWDFMASIPFQTLSPRQDLRNSGYMLANPGELYLCYLPDGGNVDITVDGAGAPYTVTWINAQNPGGDQRVGGTTSDGHGLAAPDAQDWLVYLTRSGTGGSNPEVHVTGNGAGIADGDTSPSSTDNTDFGSVDVASGSAVRVFTILNIGASTLAIGTVTTSGSNATDFTVTVQPPALLASGSNATFTVKFDPSAPGLRTAILNFSNNDPNENPYDFAIQGTGGASGSTIAWYHFEETPGTADPGNPIVNYGSAGPALNLTDTGGPDGRDNTGAGGYGAASYEGFGKAFDVLASGSGIYEGGSSGSTTGGGLQTAAGVLQSSLQGADGAFTYEALIKLSGITNEQVVLSHDGANGSRGFLFRILSGKLSFYNGSANIEATIPTAGTHAFAANSWFHVAVTYTGEAGTAGNVKFYWTALSSLSMTANQIGAGTLSADLAGSISNKLGIGTTTRSPFRFGAGFVDEVRISGGARGADDFVLARESLDSDGDGMPNDWEIQHGLDPQTPGVLADTDGDGMADLLEFALDLNPTAPDANQLPQAELETGYLTLTVPRNPSASNLVFEAEVSGNLTNWLAGTDHVTTLQDTPEVLKVRDNIPASAATARFMRLKVSLPE